MQKEYDIWAEKCCQVEKEGPNTNTIIIVSIKFKIVELIVKMMDRPMPLWLLERRACKTVNSAILGIPIPEIVETKSVLMSVPGEIFVAYGLPLYRLNVSRGRENAI